MRKAHWVAIACGLLAAAIVALRVYAIRSLRHADRDQDAAVEQLRSEFNDPAGGGEGAVITRIATSDSPPTEALIRAVRSNDENLRRSAAKTLGFMVEPRAVDTLIEGMNRNDQWCAWALGRIGDARAVPPLLTMLEKSTKSLMDLGAKPKATQPAADAMLNEMIAAGNSGAPTGFTEVAIIEALGNLKDPRAIQPLVNRQGNRI